MEHELCSHVAQPDCPALRLSSRAVRSLVGSHVKGLTLQLLDRSTGRFIQSVSVLPLATSLQPLALALTLLGEAPAEAAAAAPAAASLASRCA